jgi:hypothetical protein
MSAPSTPRHRCNLNDPRVIVFLDWLCTVNEDREPPTQVALAAELSVSPGTLSAWKNDGEFLRAWEQRYRKTVGSPEKAQQVITKLYETATDRTDPRQVPAARAYLEAIDAVKPKKMDVTVTRSAKELSDNDLIALLAERAEAELTERADA